MENSVDDILHKIWYGQDEGSFAGIKRLYSVAKKQIPLLTIENVRDFLAKQDTYQLYFENLSKKISPLRSYRASHPGQLFGVDTLHSNQTGSQFKYYLIGVDYFSKYSYIAPLRAITAKNMARAINNMINTLPFTIKTLVCFFQIFY